MNEHSHVPMKALWDWHWISYNFYDSLFLPFRNVKTILSLRAAQTLEVATFGPFWPAGYHLPTLALDFSFRVDWTGIVESPERAHSVWYSIISFGVWGVSPWSEPVLYLFPAALYRLWSKLLFLWQEKQTPHPPFQTLSECSWWYSTLSPACQSWLSQPEFQGLLKFTL